jgi:hypothetical protein
MTSSSYPRSQPTPEKVAAAQAFWLRALTIDKVDNRYRPPRPYRAVECEALGQAVLERMLRRVLDRLLPEPLERVQVREQRQRTALAKLRKRAR